MALEELKCFFGIERGFAMNNQLPHGAKDPDPAPVDGCGECLRELVLYKVARVPPDASAHQVANDDSLNEKQVHLNLVVEAAWDLK